MGEAPEVRNLFVSGGFNAYGVTGAGGAGMVVGEWVLNGAPPYDVWSFDIRRFGAYHRSDNQVLARSLEGQGHHYTIIWPHEEMTAGRPLRRSAIYGALKERRACFGAKFGWERPNWFASEGMAAEDDWSFRRSKWFAAIGREVANVTSNVGLLDMTAFAKCRVSGPGAESFLDYFVANRLPRKIGGIGLCHALNSHGGVHSEFTIVRESSGSFYLVSAGALQRLDHDYLRKFMPRDGSVRFTQLTSSQGVLVLSGPRSKELLERVSSADFSNRAFRWLTAQNIRINMAPVTAMRVNYIGELGWEIHHSLEYQNRIFDALFEAGEDLGLKPFGIRAMDSMRLEKSYRMVGTELSIEYSAYESALDRFIQPDKGDFLGREALLASKHAGLNNLLVTLEVKNVEDADALGNNALTLDGELVGRATGGGFGFRVNKSLALGMVKAELAIPGTELQIEILGKTFDCVIVPESPFDPENERLRNVNGANNV